MRQCYGPSAGNETPTAHAYTTALLPSPLINGESTCGQLGLQPVSLTTLTQPRNIPTKFLPLALTKWRYTYFTPQRIPFGRDGAVIVKLLTFRVRRSARGIRGEAYENENCCIT